LATSRHTKGTSTASKMVFALMKSRSPVPQETATNGSEAGLAAANSNHWNVYD
jgi:hypothetical protein